MYSPSNMRWLTMDPLCEKYYSISPYAYCKGDPVNRIDPDGCVDWKVVGKGALGVAAGVGEAAGGFGLIQASGGACAGGGVLLFVDGISTAGMGMAKIVEATSGSATETATSDAQNNTEITTLSTEKLPLYDPQNTMLYK